MFAPLQPITNTQQLDSRVLVLSLVANIFVITSLGLLFGVKIWEVYTDKLPQFIWADRSREFIINPSPEEIRSFSQKQKEKLDTDSSGKNGSGRSGKQTESDGTAKDSNKDSARRSGGASEEEKHSGCDGALSPSSVEMVDQRSVVMDSMSSVHMSLIEPKGINSGSGGVSDIDENDDGSPSAEDDNGDITP